ncbi:MAG: hypothetical protein ABIO72_04315 [Patescibacteria group bacterium]
MSDISLLPDEMRRPEEELKKAPVPQKEDNLKMYVPKSPDEDVEIIEVDEGDVGDVLQGESFLAKALFQAQTFVDDLKSKLFDTHAPEPPPKLPPQFFKPPTARKPGASMGLVPTSGTVNTPSIQPGTGIPTPKARIMPIAQAPKRVRVIRRVRKSVRVSFLEEQDVRGRVDISRRRFTLILLAILFVALIGGSYWLLDRQGQLAGASLSEATSQLAETQQTAATHLSNWESFRDLEPRLKSLSGLLNRHLSPSRLFDTLEKNTVPDVYYSSFTLAPDGQLILGATAPTFTSAARQVAAFQTSGMARSVQAMGYQARYNAQGTLDAVNFQIILALEPTVLMSY